MSNLTKYFSGTLVLKDISFSLPNGTITGIIGKNGAGKTTIIKCITSFYDDYVGEILLVNGNNQRLLSINDIAYVPDKPVYYEELNLDEHLKFISAMNNTQFEVDSLIDRFSLKEYLNKFPHELSKGTLQRMQICLAILRNADLIIADEPFDGLDPLQVQILKNEFLKLKELGKTILVSSHQLDLIQKICDRYVIIDSGKVVYGIYSNYILVFIIFVAFFIDIVNNQIFLKCHHADIYYLIPKHFKEKIVCLLLKRRLLNLLFSILLNFLLFYRDINILRVILLWSSLNLSNYNNFLSIINYIAIYFL